MNEHHVDVEVATTVTGTQTRNSSTIVCDHCGQKFNKKTTFNDHIEKKHGGSFKNKLNIIQESSYKVPPGDI